MSDQNWSVSAGDFANVPEGIYDANVDRLEKFETTYRGETRDMVRWHFGIPSLDDAQVSGISSLSLGATAKPAEWSRRILGKSKDTDTNFGRDAKGKKEPVNWGPFILQGKPCQVQIEIREDNNGTRRSNVVNVFAPGSFDANGTNRAAEAKAKEAEADEEQDFEGIDMGEADEAPF
jgi:hypothetical protein